MTLDAPQSLSQLGQSLWLDNISRDLLDSGTLAHYIAANSVTGLTSNPTIFEHSISRGESYDDEIQCLSRQGLSGEKLLFNLAVQDLQRAADLFSPIHARTAGVDGFVSLEVSPRLAYDTQRSMAQAKLLHKNANVTNLFIKIPGTQEGLPAIEQAIFAGIPINVTLLFSTAQYQAASNAYLTGLERRVAAGLSPDVRSVASMFISRWDVAIEATAPAALRNKLGIAVGQQCYRAYRDVLDSDRYQRLENVGARPQRLLFASTGTKDPALSPTLYVHALAAPNTVNTMPDATLLAFAKRGIQPSSLPRDGGDCDAQFREFSNARIDLSGLGDKLQKDGAQGFVDSWTKLLAAIDTKMPVNA